MNTKSGLTLAILLLAGSALGSYAARTQEAALKTHTAKLSYSMGLQVGRILAIQNIDIDAAVFLQGLRDGRSSEQAFVKEGQLHEAAVRSEKAL